MRNLFLSFSALFFSVTTFAQADISAGVMFTGAGSISLKGDVDMLASVAPALNLVTEKTNHHVMVGFASDKEMSVEIFLQTLHAFSVGNDWEIYAFFQTPLKRGNSYLSFGLEKAMTAMSKSGQLSNTLIIPFLEVGTNLKGGNSISLGMTINWAFLKIGKK